MSIIEKLKSEGKITVYYDFRAGHANDLSGNARHATLTGKIGKSDKGLALLGDGTNDNSASVPLAAFPGTDGTILCFNKISNPYSTAVTRLWGTDHTGGSNFEFRAYAISTSVNLGIPNGSGLKVSTYTTQEIPEIVCWNWDYDGTTNTTAKVYLNGILADTDVFAGPIIVPDVSFLIGKWGSDIFDGDVYSFICISRALTQTEIAELSAEIRNLKFPSKVVSKAKSSYKVIPETNMLGGYNFKPINNKILNVGSVGAAADGTLSPGVWGERKVIGDYLSFNGTTGYVDCGANYAIGTSDYSFSGWIRIKDAGVVQTICATKTGATATPGYMFRTDTSGNLSAYISFGGGYVLSNQRSTGALVANAWYHVAWTLDRSGNSTFYINGQADGTPEDISSFSASNLTNNNNFTFGLMSASTFGALDIASFKIHNKCLTADEVANDFDKSNNFIRFKTDWGAVQSTATEGGVTAQYLSNTPFQHGNTSGRYKISMDTVGGELCKVIECTTAGFLYADMRKYNNPVANTGGKWEFWLKQDSSGSTFPQILFSAAFPLVWNAGTQFAYYLRVTSGQYAQLARIDAGSDTVLMRNAASSISAGSWNKYTITRDYLGNFTVWINDVLLVATAGTNPVQDVTYADLAYMTIEIDAGDKMAYSNMNGNISIFKSRFD